MDSPALPPASRVSPSPASAVALSPLWQRTLEAAGLSAVAEKVLAGKRLSAADGIRLYDCPDINAVGFLANVVRERRNGNRAYFIRNLHLNYTNVCSKRCRFCSFYTRPGGPAPYTLTPDDVRTRLGAYAGQPLSEVHIVGGINPELPYSYYLDLVRAVKDERPEVHVKAFTMVEVEQAARVAGKPLRETLVELKAAGVDSLPGGGAEVLTDRLHEQLHPRKLSAQEWLETARTAHEVGLTSTATMLYGHVERSEERVEHLLKLRALQDETGGFRCFVPLSFHPAGTELVHLPGPGGMGDLKNIAVPRLLLDNFPHVKSFWIMTGVPLAQVSLWYGADDLDGTIQQYEVTRDPEHDTRQALTWEQLVALIRETGREPVERDSLYRALPDN